MVRRFCVSSTNHLKNCPFDVDNNFFTFWPEEWIFSSLNPFTQPVGVWKGEEDTKLVISSLQSQMQSELH